MMKQFSKVFHLRVGDSIVLLSPVEFRLEKANMTSLCDYLHGVLALGYTDVKEGTL